MGVSSLIGEVMKLGICEKTGKKQMSKASARVACFEMQGRALNVRFYKCKECKWWHVGHKRDRPRRRGKIRW